ncbi:para-aminobenzoate synthase [Poronia punctata]|nr:para-aminobenzoate synthase [Poronia punctata]
MGSLEHIPAERVRLLFVDAFDSFTNNIVGLLEECLHADVTLVHMNDETVDRHLVEILDTFDAVVIGPGPGHPANPNDVGFINKLWRAADIPMLGICLGFQSLCHSHGAEVLRLRRARHGIISQATHKGIDIFAGIEEFHATQYHSLHVKLRRGDDVFWEPSPSCPSLEPLAWDTGDEVNGPILMAVRHTEKPFWGVQFHPESICTSEAGKELIKNWWRCAAPWLKQRDPRVFNGNVKMIPSKFGVIDGPRHSATNGHGGSHLARELRNIAGQDEILLRWGRHSAASVSPTELLEALGYSQEDVILLDSQGHKSGRYSIIGLVVPGKTLKITYKVSTRTLKYGFSEGNMFTAPLGSIEEIWPILQEALDQHNPRGQRACGSSTPQSDGASRIGMDRCGSGHLPTDSPFWGGLMGYISYEAGLETIDVDLHESCAGSVVPDVNFAFIHRSIVIDHANNVAYTQSLLPGDWDWIHDVGRTIDNLAYRSPNTSRTELRSRHELQDMLSTAIVQRPAESEYRAKVLRCQDFLASGDSYELCLTDESKIHVLHTLNNEPLDSWALYKQLRRNNPAPFGAFLKLSDVVVVGSSPERFLSWTRQGKCQFRPIKGTVKKGPDMTSEKAHAILGSSKERAENLMIVDLIRHDLGGVVGAENTWVSKLMVVEEYETVYQLVSVIEGQLPSLNPNSDTDTDVPRGIHVLKASLPPGSMTGAPKKRSCEILREIERRPRGVYSGVLGYMDVGGAGDFSVVIRTAVRAAKTAVDETWHVGAGGAVTIQSTDDGEFEEMETKASSVLGALLRSGK